MGRQKGCISWMKGKHHTEETLKKMRRIIPWNKGLTKETSEGLRRLSEKSKGNTSSKGHIPWNKGVSLSRKLKEKISKAKKGKFTGENNPSWRGGISFEPYGIEFNNKLREKIKQRNNYTCQLCGDRITERRRIKINPSKNWLVVHHIDYDKRNNNPDNLITLCNFCNISVNTSRDEWTEFFSDLRMPEVMGVGI